MPFFAILLISFALLVDEIMLSAIFHVQLGAGNTVTAISIALIGLSAGGIFAYSVPAMNAPERAAELYPKLLFWFSAALLASAFLIIRVPIGHGDLIYRRGDVGVQLWRLVIYHLAVLPFFLGGLSIAVVLRSEAHRVGRLYFCDLAGAAAGCAASPFLLSWAGAPAAIVVGAAPGTLLACWLILRRKALPRPLLVIPVTLLTIAAAHPSVGTFATLNTTGDVNDPTYRSFPIDAGDLEFERWALDAWTIVRGDEIPQQWENFRGWGLSPRYEGPVPEIKLINYNARFSTYVTEFDGDFSSIGDWMDSDLTSIHFQLGRSYERVLNIGAGGGREVLAALQHGAERVVAVDISDVVVNDIMRGHLREFSGDLYFDPRVEAVADEGRSYTERTSERFDLIDFSIVGGANLEKMDLVNVDDLFTLEAMRTYVGRLTGDGVFSYVMYSLRSDLADQAAARDSFSTQPYIPAVRTLAALRSAFEEDQPRLRFSQHVLIAALPGVISPTYDLVHIIASKTPFDDQERARFTELCKRYGFDLLYPVPDGDAAGIYASVVEAASLEELGATLPFGIQPTTDDRPFQYSLEWSQVWRAVRDGSLLSLLAANAFISLGASIGGLALFVLAVPLLVIRIGSGRVPAELGRSWRLMLYFAGIGYGYMAVEISALLRLQSYLGMPIYGLSVALFAFLLFSGVGSYLTHRIPTDRLRTAVAAIVGAVFVAGLGFLAVSDSLFAATISLPVLQRALVAVAAILPLALPMGMLFPIGVRLIAGESAGLIPWAWAVNGCMSVVGILGTRVAALLLGFSRALFIGLLCYLFVSLCVWAHQRHRAATL